MKNDFSESGFFLSAELMRAIDSNLDSGTSSWKKVSGLNLSRIEKSLDNRNCFYSLSLALILQGEKIVDIGDERYRYGGGTMVVTSIDLPASFRIINATREKPFYSLSLKLDIDLLSGIAMEAGGFPRHAQSDEKSFCVTESSVRILDAFNRLLSLTADPNALSRLVSLAVEEIHCLVLTDGNCANLRELCANGMHGNRISKAVKWMKAHYREKIDVAELADIACMSVSTFYASFKKVTSMTPLQYVKRLRLQEAKRMMLFENSSATNAAFDVGYESAQQFSREYKRLFGNSPVRDTLEA